MGILRILYMPVNRIARRVRIDGVIIVNEEMIEDFLERYRNATPVFLRWKSRLLGSSWSTPLEATRTMPGVRSLGQNRLLFDVGGGNYRLLADVDYVLQQLTIQFVVTHGQYDRIIRKGDLRSW